MMRIIMDENLLDGVFIEMRTENYSSLRDSLYTMNLDELIAVTGVPADLIGEAAIRMYAGAQKGVSCYLSWDHTVHIRNRQC